MPWWLCQDEKEEEDNEDDDSFYADAEPSDLSLGPATHAFIHTYILLLLCDRIILLCMYVCMYVWADKQPLSPVSGSVGAGGGNQEEKDMSDYHDPDPAAATAATAAETGEENWN